VSSATPLVHPDQTSSNVVTTQVVPVADLSITKTGPSSVTVKSGDQFAYTLKVNNAGPSTASNVTVTDALPGGLTLASWSAGWACTGTPVKCTLTSPLPKGATSDLVLSVTVSGAGGTISNQASVSSDTSDPNLSNNSATAQTAVNRQVDEQM